MGTKLRIFHNRPLALAGCVFALAALLALRCEGIWKLILLIPVLLTALTLTLVCLIRHRCGAVTEVLILCLAAAGLALTVSYCWFNLYFERNQRLVGTPVSVEGTVLDRTSSTSYSASFRIRIDVLNGKKRAVTAEMECTYASSLRPGDRFRTEAVPRAFEETDYISEADSFLADGCTLILVCDSPDDCALLPEKSRSPRIFLSLLNEKLSMRLRETVGGEEGALAAALLLGNRASLHPDTALRFRRAGISHLLALSGLHVSILIGAAELFLRKCRLSKKIRACTVPLLALLYVALTGNAVSTRRAVLMVCILYLGYLLREDYDPFTALSAILIPILTVTPYAVLDLSLWMTFFAAGSIVIFSPVITGIWKRLPDDRKPSLFLRFLRAFGTAVAVGVAANCALLLLCALVFGELSAVSVPATLVISPLLVPLLVLSAVLCAAPAIPLLPGGCALLSGGVLRIAGWFSERQDVLVPFRNPTARGILYVLTAVLILLAVLKVRRQLWFFLPVLLAVASFAVAAYISEQPYPEGIAVRYLHGYGGEALLFSDRGESVAVDFTDGTVLGAVRMTRALREEGCTELDDLILTHYHNRDTYLLAVLSSEVRVRSLHLPEPLDEGEKAIAARIAQEAATHGIDVTYDCSSLAVEGLRVLCCQHADTVDGSHQAVLFSAFCGESVVTGVSASVLRSELDGIAENYAATSDVLVVCADGYSTVHRSFLPAGSTRLRRLILADWRLYERFPHVRSDTELICDVEDDRFFLK